MDVWADVACRQVMEKCSMDPEYQKILAECREREQAYRTVLQGLEESQRRAVDDYVAICEELEFQFARLAFACGLRMGEERAGQE